MTRVAAPPRLCSKLRKRSGPRRLPRLSTPSTANPRAAQKASAAGLLKAVLDEFTDSSSAKASQPKYEGAKDLSGLRTMILEDITKQTAVVDAKAEANEAKDFKMWLYKVANDTAEAAKEGDFMGIGGVKVNQAEKDALAQLATVMGVQAV